MRQIRFTIEGGSDVTVFAQPGENLLELARKANVAIDAPCSGNGSCGKCRVKLEFGELDVRHSRHISQEERQAGWILACESAVSESDAVVAVPDIASAYRNRMKISDLSDENEIALFSAVKDSVFSAGINAGTSLKTLSFKLDEPSLTDTLSDLDRVTGAIRSASGISSVTPVYGAMAKLPVVLRESSYNVTCLLDFRGGDTALLLDVWNSSEKRPVCGLAVDIGTTTVSALIAGLENHEILAKASSGNGQIRYGADVINRIIEASKPGGIKKLQDAVITETLIPLINTMCASAGISSDCIYKICVTANTTMNHLLLAIDPQNIRMEPYIPAFMEISGIKARDINLPACPDAEILVAPNVGSYVGGDITAGTLASMIWNRDEFSLFIDLGTNGELVFGNSDFLISCACSAGPAFEGGDISCGMRATDGAIESITIDGATLEPVLNVIGSEKQRPVGLCGSGLIDTIAEMYRTKIIDPSGRIIAEGKRIKVTPEGSRSYILAFQSEAGGSKDIEISEIDIDNFIRAKGAIYSAVRSMLRALDFEVDVIDKVYIAGGIGSGINIENAVRIGMLPDIGRAQYSYIGNSSLTGAYSMLISGEAEQKVLELARNMTYMDLSSEPNYMEEFVSACFIPHTNSDYFPSVTLN